jgi:hypothetical protein
MPFPQAKDLGQPSREALWRSGTQISNHRRLLRARRERPRGGAAEQCHEVAPLHRAHPDPRIMGSIAAGQNRASQQKRPAHVRFGSKADERRSGAMSALPPKADIDRRHGIVRFVSEADIGKRWPTSLP